jgi:hypothetical protein
VKPAEVQMTGDLMAGVESVAVVNGLQEVEGLEGQAVGSSVSGWMEQL